MKVAITTDWLNSFGGAERVLVELHRMFPEAPIYTSVYDPSGLPEFMQGWDVRPSFLQRIPFAKRRHQRFLPLMPVAFEQFDMREYDLVIATSSACSKGVITRPEAVTICYCHTPPRYLWDLYPEYMAGSRAAPLIAPVATWLRMWDRLAADRIDHFVSNSRHTAGRVKRYYGREAEVIYPPVDVDRFVGNGHEPEDFYLVVSRLVPYKRVDLAIEACNRMGRRLVVVGDGPERKRLQSIAGSSVSFLGKLGDEDLADLYARCRALIFPGHEDFGIVPVEVQAAGRPAVAYRRGGAAESVLDGETGVLFDEQTVDGVMEGLRRFEGLGADPAACRRNAERFSAEVFRARFRQKLARVDNTGSAREEGRVAAGAAQGEPSAAPWENLGPPERACGRADAPDDTPDALAASGDRVR